MLEIEQEGEVEAVVFPRNGFFFGLGDCRCCCCSCCCGCSCCRCAFSQQGTSCSCLTHLSTHPLVPAVSLPSYYVCIVVTHSTSLSRQLSGVRSCGGRDGGGARGAPRSGRNLRLRKQKGSEGKCRLMRQSHLRLMRHYSGAVAQSCTTTTVVILVGGLSGVQVH